MWSNVLLNSLENPPSRFKHSCVLVPSDSNYILYLYGGRSGTFPLKDFWALDIKKGEWTELKPLPSDDSPNYLQEHSMCYNGNNIYIFGGEISFSYVEPPLWIYHVPSNTWRRWKTSQKKEKIPVRTPVGRRGHTAVNWNGYMIVYGGYRDLKGSLNDLWGFHFETESWHLFSEPPSSASSRSWLSFLQPSPSTNTTYPPGRHNHIMALCQTNLYVQGGMNDLHELNDFWKYDLKSRRWTQIKSKNTPTLHSHVAITTKTSLLLLTGSSQGKPIENELYRYDFGMESWEKISFSSCRPCPRTNSWAGIILPSVNVALDNSPNVLQQSRKKSVFSQFLYPSDYQALSESNSVMDEDEYRPPDLIDFKCGPNSAKVEGPTNSGSGSTRRSESANCLQNEKIEVRKSNSTVRFADEINKGFCTSDYSSMENFSFENPNYPINSIEMGQLNRGRRAEPAEAGATGTEAAAIPEPSNQPCYMLLIGGNESHSSQVVKKPLSIWRLRLDNELFGAVTCHNFTLETTTGF